MRDAELLGQITRVHSDPTIGRGLYGVRKVWHQLHREEFVVARCTVERLMRSAGLQGIRRGKQFVTTTSDPAATRPPDLVQRDFTASGPNALWVVDFTYVPTWSGMTFTAFVSEVFSPKDRAMAHRRVDADRAAAGRVGDGVVDPRQRRRHGRRPGAPL